jgi:hypothetical protein
MTLAHQMRRKASHLWGVLDFAYEGVIDLVIIRWHNPSKNVGNAPSWDLRKAGAILSAHYSVSSSTASVLLLSS